jgi:large subunit ribosomal protein L6
MSRIGKLPVPIPSGVTFEMVGEILRAKGKLGERSVTLGGMASAKIDSDKVTLSPLSDSKQSQMRWGTARALVRNMVQGVSQGFTRNLEINGVGYRAAVQGNKLTLQLGFSHDVNYAIPEGITIRCDKPTSISIAGADKQRVGQVAAEIRAFRKPEPYKGKGIKHATETIRRKEGKKK